MKRLIEDVNLFYEECKSGEYIESGDDEDKRAAYACGDHYLEDYEAELIDRNYGVELFVKYLKKADEYFKQGEYDTVSQAYKVLIDVYNLDSNNNCFIKDEDFPDAGISSVPEVDLFKIEKRYMISLERMKSEKFDYLEFLKRNLNKDEKYYEELIENLIKKGRWEEVIKYGEEVIKNTESSNWPKSHYYHNYNEWVRDAYKKTGDDNKAYEYQKGIYYNKQNTGGSLKLYAETKEYARAINREEEFRNEVLKYFKNTGDDRYYDEVDNLINLAQVLLYESYYDEALKIARKFALGYSGSPYNPVKVYAYFFTYIGMRDEVTGKNIKLLFNEMQTIDYANTPYKPLMYSIIDKKLPKEQIKKFLYDAISCYKQMIDHIVGNKYRHEYKDAAHYVGVMKEIYEYLKEESGFEKYYSSFLEKYRRFRALNRELDKVI